MKKREKDSVMVLLDCQLDWLERHLVKHTSVCICEDVFSQD
jgi:hypothetical protein